MAEEPETPHKIKIGMLGMQIIELTEEEYQSLDKEMKNLKVEDTSGCYYALRYNKRDDGQINFRSTLSGELFRLSIINGFITIRYLLR